MKVVIRADASAEIGGGHVMRCLTLAGALVERGADVTFASRAGTTETVSALAQSKHGILQLEGVVEGEPKEMADRIGGPVDVLVVDHYGWGAAQEAACRPWVRRIAVIDDLADRPHDCDVVLDQNLGRRDEDYAGLVPVGARLLIGPQYALLRPEFALLRPAALARRAAGGPVRRILVSMGLTDPANASAVALEALDGLPGLVSGAIEVRVVLGRGAPHRADVEAKAAAMGARVHLVIEPPYMAQEMADADLCIGAGGSSSWERCCLGLPTIVVVVAENQRAGAEALEKAGACRVARVKADGLATLIVPLIRESGELAGMTRLGSAIADGLGDRRVAAILRPERDRSGRLIVLRRADRGDIERTFQWQLAPGVRDFARTKALPTRAEHEAWFRQRLEMAAGELHIICVDDAACGVLRLDPLADSTDLEISILVAPEFWGQGIAAGALKIAAFMFQHRTILANVLDGNDASHKVFLGAGFQAIPERSGNGSTWYQLPAKTCDAGPAGKVAYS